jgi:hypothetical protein
MKDASDASNNLFNQNGTLLDNAYEKEWGLF